MKNFKGGQGGFGGGGQRFGGGANKNSGHSGGGKFGGGQSRGFKGGDKPRERNDRGEMFSATCSTCGKPCEVPFRPSPDKPVYCSSCFGKMGQDGGGREFKNGDRREPEFKRDAQPQRDERRQDDGHGDIKRQLAALEVKLNKILDIINPPMPKVKAEVTTSVATGPKKERKPKTVKVKAPAKKKVARVAKNKITKVAPTKATVKKVAKKAAKKTKK